MHKEKATKPAGKRRKVSKHEGQHYAQILFDDTADIFDVCYTEGSYQEGGDFLRITSIVLVAGESIPFGLEHKRIYREKDTKLWNEVREALTGGATWTLDGFRAGNQD